MTNFIFGATVLNTTTMERWIGNVAMVTGASSGIGAAIVERLVEEGMIVVGLARRLERMEEIREKVEGKKGSFHPIKCDVSNEQELLEAFEFVKENLGPVHVLINNAGHAKAANLMDGTTELWRQILDVNILALCVATREAITIMRENNIDGHIIHINSIFGHIVNPTFPLNMYGATKFAVTALTEILRYELLRAGSKIKVTSISPGITKTEIFEAAGISYDAVKEALGGNLPYILSEDIAEAIVYVLATPPNVRVSELIIKPVDEEI